MSKLTFCYFMDYEDGKMARVETTGETRIPVNIFIDNANEVGDVQEGPCSIDICGVSSNIEVFSTEEEFRAQDTKFDVISMIPMGTFSPNPEDESFQQSPHILFTGKVLHVERNPFAEPNEPNCCLLIETLELAFNLYLRYESDVEIGFIVHGVAWLFGDLSTEG